MMISSSTTRRFGRSFLVAHGTRKNQIRNVEIVRTWSSNQNNNAPMSNNSFSDMLNSFRLKAANALTSSLPEDERTQLLNKFQPPSAAENDNDDNSQEEEENEKGTATIQTSIDEAVATARAQEAALHTKKWEREKEKLMKEAEDAARARVESDIAIQKRQLAFEAWKKALEREKEGKNEVTAEATNNTNGDVQHQEIQPVSNEENEHPILGPVLIDLGSKRIHIANVQALASIPVWKKQRIYRHGRAKTMANDKLKTLHLGLPGIIGIFEAKNGSLSIIDGQHRIGMLRVLQENSSDFDFGRILVEVYPQRDDIDETAHAKEIFLEVNKAEPVKLVDLPGVASSKDRNIINDGATFIQERFVEMFKPSQRCRPPHLNIDNFRDALFASNVLERHSLKTAKALEAWLLGQNEMLSVKFQDEEAQKLVSPTALKKAIKFDFYLGLDSSWLYN